jgi:aspartyl/glutamyl-tRNA(Asn/Gln) amidotransferase C subunit
MLLNKSDIDKIAWLARLAIAENDIPNYTRDLSNILNLVEQMDQVDTGTIQALAHPWKFLHDCVLMKLQKPISVIISSRPRLP